MANANKARCFVISPIGDDRSPERRHADMVLNSVIIPALPELVVKRSDQFGKPEMISVQMMDAIFSYELAVAVLTFRNPNVFYEIGLRHMTDKPIVHMAEVGTVLPFDNAGMATIWYQVDDWHSHDKARKEVAEQAAHVLAKGYKVGNPVTAARGHLKFAQSSDTQEVALANVQERLASLEHERAVRNVAAAMRDPMLPVNTTSVYISETPAFNALYPAGISLSSVKSSVGLDATPESPTGDPAPPSGAVKRKP